MSERTDDGERTANSDVAHAQRLHSVVRPGSGGIVWLLPNPKAAALSMIIGWVCHEFTFLIVVVERATAIFAGECAELVIKAGKSRLQVPSRRS